MENNQTDKELQRLMDRVAGKEAIQRVAKTAIDEGLKNTQINLKK